MTDIDLNQLVRDVVASSTLADPREVSAEVFRRIPSEDYGRLLLKLLPDLVRETYRTTRNHPVQVPFPSPGAKVPQPPNRSHRVDGIRNTLGSGRLLDRVHSGPGTSDWKLLGDCTFEDLMYAARERQAQAARTQAKAAEYAALAELLRASGVDRVRDLPATVLREQLEGADA